VTAKFDFAPFHRSLQRREQISTIDSRGSVIFEMRWDVAATQKANGQSVKALFNFA